MLPPPPHYPRSLIITFLLFGSLGSFVLGRELAVVANLAHTPLRAQLSAMRDQPAAVTMWGPLVVAIGSLGATPPSPNTPKGSTHPPKAPTRYRGATAPSSPLPSLNRSVSLSLASGHERVRQDHGDQNTPEQRDGNQDRGNRDNGNQGEGNQDNSAGNTSPWAVAAQSPSVQQVGRYTDSQLRAQGAQGDQGAQGAQGDQGAQGAQGDQGDQGG